MFKKNKKTQLSIESAGDTANFTVSWDKDNILAIQLFIKLCIMLNNGDLREHIEKAIEHYGKINNDEETAMQIILEIRSIEQKINNKTIENKYLNNLLVNHKRNPIVPPEEVFNIFKNSINQ